MQMYLYASRLQICLIWYSSFVWTLCTCMSETEKGCEKIAANPAQQQANFKYKILPESGHHLKYESVWRMKRTTWGVGVDTLRHGSALYYDSLPSLQTVSLPDNTENGESAASARTWWRNFLQCLTLLYPGASLQGSCCHGHCEWNSVKRSGVALQCLHTEHLVFFFFFFPFYLVYLNILLVWFNLYIFYSI